MRSKCFCILSGLLFACCLGTLHAQSPTPQPSPTPAATPSMPGVRLSRDIPYVPGGHELQRLDLYLPEADKSARPLVIWVHGGGWNSGSKDGCTARWLVEYGYAVASINYRLSTHAIYPAQIEDCKSAIRFLRAHASEYGIKPDRIGAWGASAGGHLVALLGTTGDIRDFDTGTNLDQSSKVQCVVDWFGPTDFLHWGSAIPDWLLDSPTTAVAKLLGGRVQENQENARRASPVNFVNKDAAPFLIMQGGKDTSVPLQQSQLLDAALKKAGVESTLTVFPGDGHGGPSFNSKPATTAILQFLDSHLKQ